MELNFDKEISLDGKVLSIKQYALLMSCLNERRALYTATNRPNLTEEQRKAKLKEINKLIEFFDNCPIKLYEQENKRRTARGSRLLRSHDGKTYR